MAARFQEGQTASKRMVSAETSFVVRNPKSSCGSLDQSGGDLVFLVQSRSIIEPEGERLGLFSYREDKIQLRVLFYFIFLIICLQRKQKPLLHFLFVF